MKVVAACIAVHVEDLATEIQAFLQLRFHRLSRYLISRYSTGSDDATLVTDITYYLEFPIFQGLCQQLEIHIIESPLWRVESRSLLDRSSQDIRVPRLEARDQVPRHELAEEDPVHLLSIYSPTVLRLTGSRVVFDIVPDSLDPVGQLCNRYPRLQIQRERDPPTVHQSLDTFTAYLETNGAFYSSVCEIYVTELRLREGAIIGDGEVDVLEFGSLKGFPASGHGGSAVDMPLHLFINLLYHLVTLRNKGCQGWEARSDLMSKKACPAVTVTC